MEYDKIKSEFEKIQEEIVKDVNPIFKRLIKKQDDLRDKITPIDYKEWNPPCGIFEHTATLTEEQKQEADELVDVVVTEILEDPNEKDEIVGMARAADSKGQAGTDKGDRTGYVEFLRLRFPNWLKNIQTSLGEYFSVSKKRKGIDWEETVKNVIRKPKFKMQNPADSLYVFVDTSGSMWNYTDRNGVGLLKLFGSYFPQIAQKYHGQIWFSDYAPYNGADLISEAVELSDFKKDDISRFDFGGGGGTAFWGVWQYFDKKHDQLGRQRCD